MTARCRFIVVSIIFLLASVMRAGEPEMHFPADRPLDLEHIRLNVRVDLKKKTLDGQAAIDLTALRDVTRVRFDHPNQKQTTEIVCTVDKPNSVISNGKLVEHQDNPDGTRTFHWVQDKPHAAYLMTLVVGDFFTKTVQWRGRPVSFHVRDKFK